MFQESSEMSISIPASTRAALKSGLVTGGCKDVGLQIGLSLAKRLPSGSTIFLTTKDESKIPRLTEEILQSHGEETSDKIKFAHLDFRDKTSLIKLYQRIKSEALTLDILVNNAQKFTLPSFMDDKKFFSQCEETMLINYYGLKKVCKTFSPMMNQGGRIVNCSSHLGHLSNLDGREPEATQLREKFGGKTLTEEELDRLVKEFLSLAETGSGGWWHRGWPPCPYTVSKIAVNSYTRFEPSHSNFYRSSTNSSDLSGFFSLVWRCIINRRTW